MQPTIRRFFFFGITFIAGAITGRFFIPADAGFSFKKDSVGCLERCIQPRITHSVAQEISHQPICGINAITAPRGDIASSISIEPLRSVARIDRAITLACINVIDRDIRSLHINPIQDIRSILEG